MGILTRIIAWFHRFSCCLEQLGLINTIKIFISGRLLNKFITLLLPGNLKFTCHGKLDLVTSHFYKWGYYIEKNKGPEIKTIIDGGANIGVETARFHVHYPAAEIIAIEAAKRNFEILNKNFGSIRVVTPVFGGLWPVEAHLEVISTSTDMQAFNVVEAPASEKTIPAFTIPQLMKKNQWEQIDILKLDIEGAEYELFSTQTQSWIDKVNVFIFEIPDSDYPGATQLIFNKLKHLNIRTYHCGENLVLIKKELPWTLKKVIGFEKQK